MLPGGGVRTAVLGCGDVGGARAVVMLVLQG